ncbi:hypothetical protein [Thiohalobacter thiocyanaticus]|uniref:Uncharacterized protein n=1 Tax=Thiohalobacter thiocyanaticus TaxID=585455 RepID=A0A426QJB3_9GAMM|nr:hypothetical protein [Thiohalobacter thiocyanaticus]RRQ21862.1 hypothetical protein D6C00_07825 [Thiohalobacter thiocyanaticus]
MCFEMRTRLYKRLATGRRLRELPAGAPIARVLPEPTLELEETVYRARLERTILRSSMTSDALQQVYGAQLPHGCSPERRPAAGLTTRALHH